MTTDGNASNSSHNSLALEFRVEPQFVHRTLAAQALTDDEEGLLSEISNAMVAAIKTRNIPDLRLATIANELQDCEHQVVCLRAGVYFKYEGEGRNERCRFHQTVRVDDSLDLKISGTFDPSRYEANSPRSNLAGQRNVYIIGIATTVNVDEVSVEIRPMLIGLPYFVSAPEHDENLMGLSEGLELHYSCVDQFGFTYDRPVESASANETNRLFAMPEDAVKGAFAQILGATHVPKDWAGEQSDLVGELTIEGNPARAAFAFKGPGGKPKPWVLHPARMGKNGDQGIRLFAEQASVMVVQHCGPIAESVRHMMEALATRHRKRFMILDADATARILDRAGLLD